MKRLMDLFSRTGVFVITSIFRTIGYILLNPILSLNILKLIVLIWTLNKSINALSVCIKILNGIKERLESYPTTIIAGRSAVSTSTAPITLPESISSSIFSTRLL